MSKIHPAEKRCQDLLLKEKAHRENGLGNHHDHLALTVWKRSSMSFQGTDGFTVFDSHGRLIFRVDNYSRKINGCVRGGLVLMDGVGNALLTLKPQMMSVQYQWNAYRGGEDGCQRSKIFSMRSVSGFFSTGKQVAEIFMAGEARTGHRNPDFKIEGSFRARDCKIKAANGELVASLARKRANSTVLLSDDVFSLMVQPGFESYLIMAFIIVLDRITHKPYAPILCS